jgi:hypothetical protein
MSSPFNEAVVTEAVERLERNMKDLEGRIAALEKAESDRMAVEARRSSIEVGTPAKGGALKVYLDPFSDPRVNEEAINEARRLLALAGGTPQSPQEVQ